MSSTRIRIYTFKSKRMTHSALWVPTPTCVCSNDLFVTESQGTPTRVPCMWLRVRAAAQLLSSASLSTLLPHPCSLWWLRKPPCHPLSSSLLPLNGFLCYSTQCRMDNMTDNAYVTHTVHETPTVTSHNRRIGMSNRSVWHMHIRLVWGSSLESLMVKLIWCFDAWKTMRVIFAESLLEGFKHWFMFIKGWMNWQWEKKKILQNGASSFITY